MNGCKLVLELREKIVKTTQVTPLAFQIMVLLSPSVHMGMEQEEVMYEFLKISMVHVYKLALT